MNFSYLSLDQFKSSGVAHIPKADHDTRLRQLLEHVSQEVDRHTRRHFYSVTQTRYLSGTGAARLLLPDDLISVTTLKEDADRDGIYEVTWAATDYELWPYDAAPAGGLALARPYRALEVNRRSNGTQDVFLRGQRQYELAGQWGYCHCTEDTGAVINEGAEFSTADTTLTVADGSNIEVGHTLLIDSEQLYVQGRVTEGGSDLTVARGVHGTTAAAHANGSAISRLVYPGPIVEATLMQAARLWTRRVAGYAREIGFTVTGQMQPVTGLDDDVKQMLQTYMVPSL